MFLIIAVILLTFFNSSYKIEAAQVSLISMDKNNPVIIPFKYARLMQKFKDLTDNTDITVNRTQFLLPSPIYNHTTVSRFADLLAIVNHQKEIYLDEQSDMYFDNLSVDNVSELLNESNKNTRNELLKYSNTISSFECIRLASLAADVDCKIISYFINSSENT